MPLDGDFLANPERELALAIAEAFRPPPPFDLNQWALDRVVFPEGSPRPGPYDPEAFPYFHEILEVLSLDHPASEVVLSKSAQVGGTVLGQIFVGGVLDMAPCPVMYAHPTEPNATRWSKEKWMPFRRTALADLFPTSASRDGGNSVLFQERKDHRGFIQISGANSAASLSMSSYAVMVFDDLSKWESNSAGDPEVQGDSRGKAYGDSVKKLKISTPLVTPGCKITRGWNRSDQRQFHLPCPHCGHEHPLVWECFNADPDRPGFDCPECGCLIEEKHRKGMLSQGRWVADNPSAEIVGFHIWSAYSPFESWRSIALGWVAVKGDPAREQTYFNDTLGLAYKVAGQAPDWKKLKEHAEAQGHRKGFVPVGGLLFTIGVDCQGDRVEWQAIAHGRDARRWVVDHGVIWGHISDQAVWVELNKLMAREWPADVGIARRPDGLAIDGNAWTTDVWDWVKTRPKRKVIMIRGVGSSRAPVISRVIGKKKDGRPQKAYRSRFFNVGVSPMKMALYQSLTKTDPLARAYVGLPQGLDDDYYEQLTSERRTEVRKRDGTTEWLWKIVEAGQRNEMLDTALYAEAAAFYLGWREWQDAEWDARAAELEAPEAEAQLDLEDLPLVQAAAGAPAQKKPSVGLADMAALLNG